MTDPIDFEESHVGDVAVLSVTGTIDLMTEAALRTQINRLISTHPPALVVDLSGLDFLASVGLAVLIETRNEVGDAFAVVADGPATSRPIRLTQLDQTLNLAPTLDAAVAAMAPTTGGVDGANR